MENQSDLDQPVTKQEFHELKDAFQEFAAFAGETFSTKEDVRRIVEKSEERILESNRQILTSNDGIVKELKTMREEQSAHSHSHKQQDEEISSLKSWLKKVEANVGLT